MTKDELAAVLEKHRKWLLGEDDGQRAVLRRANLRGADLSDAVLSGADLRRANLRRADVPVIEDIHQSVLSAIETDGNELNMSDWHTCDTTHCRAGWVIHLAGKPGYDLGEATCPSVAAALIYFASDPSMERVPDFHDSNIGAMEDIRRMAKAEAAAKGGAA